MKRNVRFYGKPPFRVVVLHGGPGAAGGMAPVARELSAGRGVIEPLQTAVSINGQVQELQAAVVVHGDPPVTLIGWSWGAWLGLVFTARHPSFVKKLILVGSGPFEERYAGRIMETRLGRLSEAERKELRQLTEALGDPAAEKGLLFSRWGKIFLKADAFDPLSLDSEVEEVRFDIYQSVWGEAEQLRGSGKLLELAGKVRCPVIVIHGAYDPHPFEGVEIPLFGVVKDFRFTLIERCGHQPWIEREARERFFKILEEEL